MSPGCHQGDGVESVLFAKFRFEKNAVWLYHCSSFRTGGFRFLGISFSYGSARYEERRKEKEREETFHGDWEQGR